MPGLPHPVLVATSIAVAAALGPLRPAAATRSMAAPVMSNMIASHIADASRRFGIPERWIRSVIRAESGGRIDAVSPAGAIGLMQLMPATWRELSSRYALGTDPFDPRDNIMAGTAYLRLLFDRFGSPGFLAAYNAGPRRFETHLSRGRSLPAETVAYVARLASEIGFADPSAGIAFAWAAPAAWMSAPIFAGSAGGVAQTLGSPLRPLGDRPVPVPDGTEGASHAASNALFVPASTGAAR